MAGPMMGGMNPLMAMLSPDQQQSYAQLQMQQAIGQNMLQQGQQPVDMGQYPVGGMSYRVSPLNGIAKVLQSVAGAKMMRDSMGQQAQLMGQMYGNAFGGGQQSAQQPQQDPTDAGGMTGGQSGPGVVSAPVPTPGAAPSGAALGAAMGGGAAPAQPAPQAQMPNGALTLPGKTPQQSMMIFSMLGPEGYARILSQWAAPTDATRLATAAGMPTAPANAAALAKANYIPPISGTGILRNPLNPSQPVAFNPAVPEGSQPLFDASGNVARIQPIAGAQATMQGNAAATAAGEGSQLPYAGVDAQGNPLPVTSRTAAVSQAGATTPASSAIVQAESVGNQNAVSPKGALGAWQVMPNTNANPGFGVQPAKNNSPAEMNRVGQDYYNAMTQRYGSPTIGAIAYNMGPGATDSWLKSGGQFEKLPQETQNYVGKVSTLTALNSGAGLPQVQSGAIYAAPPMGAQAGATSNATNLQNEMSKKWTDLNAANQQAQSTVSYLQNIKTLAPAAATGPQADRLNYANGLLSLAGSEKATDAVTATDLLNKYSNQITARLSANGMGTDSARTILQSAYPNAHMTPQAISEAADNLIGAQQMTQAKTRLLAPLRNAGDAQGYTNTEMQFDQNADPRIFQYANIQDPTARAAFAKNLMQQDPKIVTKIQALQKLGAMQ
ncbi:soluble lytic murein transglycosylase-like protein [Caballeronia udeis]|uniref:Soluble lytic murein transglycosylase-like protein n=1 Tax=Caballeronia udeis TaxID=1232866 RepID=A0ABW8MLV0_9BURK